MSRKAFEGWDKNYPTYFAWKIKQRTRVNTSQLKPTRQSPEQVLVGALG